MTRTRTAAALVASAVIVLSAAAASAQTPDDTGADVGATAARSMIQSVEVNRDWPRMCIEIDGSSTEQGTDALLHNCERRGGNTWDHVRQGSSTGGTPLYELRNVHSGLCLSLEGTETDPSDRRDVQQETCYSTDHTLGRDARWWFKSLGNGQYLIRPYLINSRTGEYPCLEADYSDEVGQMQVQLFRCGNSRYREWRLPTS